MARGRKLGRRSTDHDATADPAGEFPFPVVPYLFHLFTTITRLRDALLDKALKPLGLNVSRHRAIAVIALLEPCTMTDLADLSAIDRTTMTRIVDQLVERDRRQVLLSLTPKGRRTYAAALKAIEGVNREALRGLPDETLRAVARAEQAIVANIAPSPERAARLLRFRRD
jgi:DNA-binding MarR family transcriptional regulator